VLRYGLDGAPINRDLVLVGIDEEAGRWRTLAVDANSPGRDQLVSGAAAGDAGSREEPVQPLLRPVDCLATSC
jgi:hypothetical protein